MTHQEVPGSEGATPASEQSSRYSRLAIFAGVLTWASLLLDQLLADSLPPIDELIFNPSSNRIAYFITLGLIALPYISAAAAFVNVRQRIRSGDVPSSIKRMTRWVRTCVFPVPALAATQTEAPGAVAVVCASFGCVIIRSPLRLVRGRTTL